MRTRLSDGTHRCEQLDVAMKSARSWLVCLSVYLSQGMEFLIHTPNQELDAADKGRRVLVEVTPSICSPSKDRLSSTCGLPMRMTETMDEPSSNWRSNL